MYKRQELDFPSAGGYGDHQTGAFPARDSDGVQPPILLTRKGICRLLDRVSRPQLGLTRGSRSDPRAPKALKFAELLPPDLASDTLAAESADQVGAGVVCNDGRSERY